MNNFILRALSTQELSLKLLKLLNKIQHTYIIGQISSVVSLKQFRALQTSKITFKLTKILSEPMESSRILEDQ